MKSAIVKRSIVLAGHKTSISLEDEFWACLRDIAALKKIKLSELLQQIDNDRAHANLSSAIRVYVFNYLRAQTAAEQQPAQSTPRKPAAESETFC